MKEPGGFRLPPIDDPDATASNVITATGRENRDGKVAFFANWRAFEHLFPDFEQKLKGSRVKPGVELGFGIGTDTPSGFLGVSLELWKYVRLGWGRTVQEVKVLDGKQVGDEVSDTASIPLRDDFVSGTYYSVTVSLSSLSLFGSGG